ncbi:MAG TPA: DUF4932 domain-containing protein [Gemmatimonadales bacterium]|nr:DUF4932 domain-containing protein [Gemmatimonadales bacterium]
MRFRAVALSFVLVVTAATAAAQSTPPNPPNPLRIGVDRRVELITIIFKLAGSEEFNPTHLPQYSADIDQFFGPQRNHEAVTLARGLRERYGVSQSRVMAIPIRLTDPPELEERVPFDSVSGWPAPSAETRRFVEAARRFAIDSRANDFFAAHRALYDAVNGRIRPALERAVDLAWFSPYFGIPSDQIFVVVPLLVAAEGNYGPCVQPPNGLRECYSIVGNTRPDSTGYPTYDAGMAGLLVHEFGHGFVNPLGFAHRAEFERSAPRVRALVADAMTWQSYPWPSMVNESLDHATEARYIAAHGDTAQLRAFYHDQLRGSWFWTEELANLYTQYEADRRTYPTFAAFMPRVIAYFDSLPARVPAMRRRYDAQRPKIVSLSIANGSDSVDAGLKEIVIQFDRSVRDDGWSVLPVFGPNGPTLEPQQTMPKILWRAMGANRVPFELGKGLDSTGTTIHLGVALEPGHQYELQFGTPHGYGFRNVSDGVPLAPYVLRFKTRAGSASLKP